MSAEIEVRGEHLLLRPDHSLFWIERLTLVIADPHFGKSDAFRAAGIPVPGGAGPALERLTAAVRATAAERLVVLGDFWHARAGVTDRISDELAAWRMEHPDLRIDLIRGNHDRARRVPPGWAERWHSSLLESPLAFAHYPEPVAGAYVLSGHLHPAVVLAGRGRQRLRLPCFWFGARVAVLPAFGEFTGASAITPQPGDRVFAAADGEVVDVSRPHTA